MITEKKIESLVSQITFFRGKNLWENHRVSNLYVDEFEDMDFITADVQGSGKNEYNVYVDVERETGHIKDSCCECPAYDAYEGLCKHCVAVLFAYLQWKHPQEESGKSRRTTSSVIKQLLIQQNAKKALPILEKEKYGKIRIEPYITLGISDCSVSFKIGDQKMYVLKDVLEFKDHMEQHVDHAYGKNLKFLHMLEAFTEETQPLVYYLIHYAHAYEKSYGRSYGYYYRGYGDKVREIVLDAETMDDFFDAVTGIPLKVQEWEKPDAVYYVTEELPERNMQIKGVEDGIEIKLAYLSGYISNRSLIYFQEGKIYRQSRDSIADIQDFLLSMGKIKDRKAFIATEDVPVFCRELLPQLEKHYKIKKIKFDPRDYGTVEPEFKFYLDLPQQDMIRLEGKAVYEEKEFSVFQRDGVYLAQNRDFEKEAQVANIISQYGNAYDESHHCMVIYQSDDAIYELFTEGIPRLQEVGEVFVSDALKRMEVHSAPKVSVGVSLSGNILELSMTAGDMSREELIEILSRYDRKKKYYRLKTGEFVQMEGQDMDALIEVRQALQLTERQLRNEQIQIPKFRALYLDTELKEHQGIAVSKNKDFRSLIRDMKTVEDNDFDIPESLDPILREYQKRGYLWLKTIKSNGFGGILADDMGLGKTLQVICFLLSEYQENAGAETMIVTPASLVFNWKQELERFAPQLPVRMITGTASERKKQIAQARKIYQQGHGEILVTSYDLLKRDISEYEELPFANQVIDEAQFIKNHGTQAAKAVKTIRAEFKLALTGTPVENRLGELWSIFDYLMPGFLFSYQKFKEELEVPITQNADKPAVARLQRMIQPFVLRRLKKDVLTDLPDKLEENYYAQLEGEQQKLYDAHVKRMKLMLDKQSDEEFKQSKIQILSELTRLRQICCDPSLAFDHYNQNSAKLDLCINLIGNAVNAGHKILLFSQFTTMLEHIEKRLTEEEISFYTLTGATSKKKRAELVKAFNEDDTSVFCISLKAGGTGLNLTAADMVIHYDPWWNVAVQNQATDRAHRIGQKNVVNVYKLIVKGTIEENIVKLQEKKQELADQILGGGEVGTGSFSREDLLEILG